MLKLIVESPSVSAAHCHLPQTSWGRIEEVRRWPFLILSELVSGRWRAVGVTEGSERSEPLAGRNAANAEFPSTTRYAGGPPPRDKLGED